MNPLALPVRTQDATFQELMAEQLRHAPWLLFSASAHALALLLLWILLPADRPPTAKNAVAIAPPTEVPSAIEPLPQPPEPRIEPVPTDEPVVLEPVNTPTDLPTEADADTGADRGADTGTLSAFTSNQQNTAIGIGGDAGGPRGGDGGRGHRRPSGGQHELAIDRGLQWLAAHQDADGRWDCDQFMKHDTAGVPCDGPGSAVHDVGTTALALLAFLGDGNTLRHGPHRERVRGAVRWLREQQDPVSGRFGTAASSDFVYDHAIAAYAMSEAYGLSQYTTLQPCAQRGLDYLQAHRNPYGAWRYQPRDGDNDTSITAWCIMALASGAHWGLVVDGNALRIAATFLESCTSADGHCGYQRAGEPSARKPGSHAQRFPIDRTDALTAAGLLCRFFLGQEPAQNPCMQKATARLLARRPVWDPQAGTIDLYYWYYGSYALFQIGGQAWRDWSKALETAVVKTQCATGNALGSWDPIDVWGEDGGRVYSTAIATLTLEAYYRYTKLTPGGR